MKKELKKQKELLIFRPPPHGYKKKGRTRRADDPFS